MDLDTIFVAGLIVGAFSIPALVNAFSERRRLLLPLMALAAGIGMVVWVVRQDPETYRLERVDEVFVTVLSRFLN